MKLSLKMAIIFISLVFVLLTSSLSYVYYHSYNAMIKQIKDKILLFVNTYESMFFTGYDKDNSGSINEAFQKYITSLKARMPEMLEINIYQIGGNSEVIASTDKTMIGKKVDPEDIEAAKNNETVVLFGKIENKKIIDVTQPLHYNNRIDYVIGIKRNIDTEYSEIFQLLLKTLAIGVIGIFIASILIIQLARKIVHPIKRMIQLVSNADLRINIENKSNDEIGTLSRHINSFSKKLNGTFSNFKNVVFKGKAVGDVLASNSNNVSSNIIEIDNTMKLLMTKIDSFNNEILKSNEAVTEIKNHIENVVELINGQSVMVNQSSAAIVEMMSSINNIAKITKEKKEISDNLTIFAKSGENDMNNTMKAIDEISKSAEVIFEMIDTINAVANRTNLLAMNASIQASHAGDYGRGFAVVADEIKRLAESSGTNAKKISSRLEKIIENIKNTHQNTKKTGKTISQMTNEIIDFSNGMNETLTGLEELSVGTRQITDSLTSLIKTTEDVKESSDKMTGKTSNVEKAMTILSTISNENMAGFDDISQKINTISDSIIHLSNLSKTNYENINIIENEVSKFITEQN